MAKRKLKMASVTDKDFPRYAVLSHPKGDEETTKWDAARRQRDGMRNSPLIGWNSACLGVFSDYAFAMAFAQEILLRGEHRHGLVICKLEEVLQANITLESVDLNDQSRIISSSQEKVPPQEDFSF